MKKSKNDTSDTNATQEKIAYVTEGAAGNTKSRAWFFTLNNYSKEEITQLLKNLEESEFVFQEETGESGTPHLQGVCRWKNAMSFKSMQKKIARAHLEKCKSFAKAINYCTKIDTRTGEIYTNIKGLKIPKKPRDYFDEQKIKSWQKEIIEILESEPDRRKIYWYWEKTGGTGKTTLARHICINNEDVIYVCGKASDIKYGICKMRDEDKMPKAVIWDLARHQNISYEGLEQIKNGIFYSTKYEAGMVIYDIPHIIVFANKPPEEHNLSKDRWIIREIASAEPSAPGGA